MLGELIVDPGHRGLGVGAGIIKAIESIYPHAPIYIKALGDSKHFYAKLGFKLPKAEMTVMFKKPWVHPEHGEHLAICSQGEAGNRVE
jgi:predicted N-acetyltransferase YhbS